MSRHHSPPGKHQGFALVELAIIVAILAILAALLPMSMDIVVTARAVECHANAAALNSAAAKYFAAHGEIAASLEALTPDLVPAIPVCPFGHPYSFDGYCISNVKDHEH